MTKSTTNITPRARWRFEQQEAEIARVLPGGAGDLGIVEFDGLIAPAHAATMLRFPTWTFVAQPPAPHLPDIDVGDGCPAGVGP